MNKTLTFLLTLLGLGASACSRPYQTASVKEFAAYIQQPDVQLADVRTADEYAEGHIDGARLIDVNQDNFVEQAQTCLDPSRPVAVYCKSGRRSAKAAELLAAEGYQVTSLAGGIIAWKLKGQPVTAPKKGSR